MDHTIDADVGDQRRQSSSIEPGRRPPATATWRMALRTPVITRITASGGRKIAERALGTLDDASPACYDLSTLPATVRGHLGTRG